MTYYSGPDLARSFRVVRKNTLQIANEIPEAQYEFRATPNTRTVAETLAHVAAATRWVHRVHGIEKKMQLSIEDFGKYRQDTRADEAALVTRAEILPALEANGEEFASWLETVPDAALGEVVAFVPPIQPPGKTRFEMLLSVKEHEMHHRGQLMLIQRLIGLVPHLTRERQARVAATR